MSAHTMGPWFAIQVPTSAGSAFRIGAAGAEKGCAWIYADGIRKGIDDELPRAQELAANARLIAAAPQLLAVARMATMMRQLGGMLPGSREIVQAIVDDADAAIAKATGVEA